MTALQGIPRHSALHAHFLTDCQMAQGVPTPSTYRQSSMKPKRIGSKRSFNHHEESGVQPTAFAICEPACFPGVSPLHKCTTVRSISMDSDVSSISPLPPAKRQCLAFRPDTPDATCHGRIVQHSAQQHAASSRHVTQAGHLSYQAMRHQHQQRGDGHVSDVAAYLHHLHQLRRTAAIHANEAYMSQRQQQQQQPPQSFVAQDQDMLHQQQWQQYKREQAIPAQRQVAPTAAAQLQDAFHNAMTSHTAASVPFKPQESNTAAPPCGHDLFDSFIHQLLGIQTPPQHQEQLPAAKLRHQAACTDAPNASSMLWQAHGPHMHMAQTHLKQPQHHLPDMHRPVLQQPAELQQPLKAQPQRQMLHHVLNMTQHIAAQHLQAQQQAVQQIQKQMVLMQRQAMLQQCLNIKQHAAVVEQQQQQQQRPTGSPSLGFPDLLLYLAKGLALQRTETVLLACHLWKKVQPQVSIAYMHLLGAGRPWESMLVGCLWVAAKLEECRRGVPTATKVGRLVQLDKTVMGGIELYLMQLVNWAPLRGWQISRV